MESEHIVTAAEMKEIERKADEAGLSYYRMMENAGTAAYRIIMERCPHASDFTVFAGKGNNGGDGFVVARLAAQTEKKVTVILVEGEPKTRDAITNFGLLSDLQVEIKSLDELDGETCINSAVIVDAVYGTGFHGDLRPAGIKACGLMNRASGVKAALDVPSGLNCDTGEAACGAVCADLTVSFHALKPAHVMENAKKYCGKVVPADIGI